MINSMLKRIVVFVCILQSLSAGAQSLHKYELGFGLGAFVYQGDLTPNRFGSFRTMRPGFQLFITKIVSPSLGIRTNLAIGSLHADESIYKTPAWRQARNFAFKSSVWELSELAVWYPMKDNGEAKGIHPYLFGGGALSFVKIKRDYSRYDPEYFNALPSDVTARLAEDINHSLPKVLPEIPMGVGVRYGISERLSVTAEGTYRLLYTDYLDGFSLAANPGKNDHYHTVMISAVYRIGKKNPLACPKF